MSFPNPEGINMCSEYAKIRGAFIFDSFHYTTTPYNFFFVNESLPALYPLLIPALYLLYTRSIPALYPPCILPVSGSV